MLGQEGQDSYRRWGKAGESQGRAEKKGEGEFNLACAKAEMEGGVWGCISGVTTFFYFCI